MAGPDRPISTLGGEARLGRVDGDERVERGVAAPDPLEERLHRVDGGERACAEGVGQLGHGGPYGIDPAHRWSPRNVGVVPSQVVELGGSIRRDSSPWARTS
jgi:hypothetical protein